MQHARWVLPPNEVFTSYEMITHRRGGGAAAAGAVAMGERLLPLRLQYRLLLLGQGALLLGQPLHAPKALQGGGHGHALLTLALALGRRRTRKACMWQ